VHEAVLSLFYENDGMEKDGNVEPRMSYSPVDGPFMTVNRRFVSIIHMKAHFMYRQLVVYIHIYIYIFVVVFCNGIVHIQ